MARFATRALAALLVMALLGLGGVGWYYAGEILNVERPGEPARDTEVLAVESGRVTLERTGDSLQRGTYGLDAPEAYARVGAIQKLDRVSVTRTFEPLSGTLRRGDQVDVDGYAYPQDPAEALDFPVTEVPLSGPLGEYPAWLAKGRDRQRWAVLVHGRAARRNECFRLLEILHSDHGFNVLCPTYRNDLGAPADPGDMYRQGAEEWRDIEPAIQYALDQGATEVLLGGFSMGGQITANLLRHSDLEPQIDAVIWDAPLLDWGPAIAAGADDRGVPRWLVPIGMQVSEWRAGVDYADLNQVEHAGQFDVPILLIHGVRDATVPVTVAERFRSARPDIVKYQRTPRAGHVQSWNRSPSQYRQVVDDFVSAQF